MEHNYLLNRPIFKISLQTSNRMLSRGYSKQFVQYPHLGHYRQVDLTFSFLPCSRCAIKCRHHFGQNFMPSSGTVQSSEATSWSTFQEHVTPSFLERQVITIYNLPDSTTTDPGLISSCNSTMLISVVYRICVRCGRLTVHSSGVGWRRYTQPFLFTEYICGV